MKKRAHGWLAKERSHGVFEDRYMIFSKNGSIIEGDIERWTYERFSVARKDLECRESERPKSLINNNAVNKTSL